MSENIGQVLFVTEDGGAHAIKIAACLTCLSLLNWIILFFGLIYIFKEISAVKECSDGSTALNSDKQA